ncbi:hypothetical protein RRG08_032731 [Elysia crispata]|uniref:Uncharacterized protein n=1 Tax=Elysia crispata TaxID=231223 RepID=A0AAE0YVT9_9GAST|nr:hypothetical protein RRG08_032731 [Elysia crispata]
MTTLWRTRHTLGETSLGYLDYIAVFCHDGSSMSLYYSMSPKPMAGFYRYRGSESFSNLLQNGSAAQGNRPEPGSETDRFRPIDGHLAVICGQPVYTKICLLKLVLYRKAKRYIKHRWDVNRSQDILFVTKKIEQVDTIDQSVCLQQERTLNLRGYQKLSSPAQSGTTQRRFCYC